MRQEIKARDENERTFDVALIEADFLVHFRRDLNVFVTEDLRVEHSVAGQRLMELL